jgi:hypothetical protein
VLFNSDLQIYEKATHRHQVYDRNKVMKSYNYLEPRLSVAYQINDDQSIKASYNRMVQYLQLISNTHRLRLMSGQVTVLLNHKLLIRWLWDISKL